MLWYRDFGFCMVLGLTPIQNYKTTFCISFCVRFFSEWSPEVGRGMVEAVNHLTASVPVS